MARSASRPKPPRRDAAPAPAPSADARRDRAAIRGLAALNFFLVLVFFRVALTRLPNTGDEFAALFQARIFAHGGLTAPAPPHAELFASHYVAVRGGRWFGIFPPVYPLLLAAGLLLGSAPAAAALLSSLSLALTFMVAREAYEDRGLAWLTTLLLFVSPAFRFYSASYYSHVGSLAAVLGGLLLLLRAERAGRDPRLWGGLGLVVALGLGIRPFEAFWVFAPAAVFAAAAAFGRARLPPRRAWAAGAAALAGALLLIVVLERASGAGALGGAYLQTVNSGGRLGLSRNLSWAGVARVWAMLADAAKWLFACGVFRGRSLKDYTAGDWNFSLPLLAGGLLFGFAAPPRGGAARPHRLLLAAALCAVLGHLFYDKSGGPFGERRFLEAAPLFCLFTARFLLAGARRLPRPWAWAPLPALIGANLCVYLPRTVAAVREGNERRLGLFLSLERRDVDDALVYLQNVPEFDRAFYARNAPDMSGNVLAACAPANPVPERLFPGRARYVYRFDWERREYVLESL